MALVITTWWWGNKYGQNYVDRLKAGVTRHLTEPHRFMCLTDQVAAQTKDGIDYRPIEDKELLPVKGCFARLRTFDPYWQFIRDITKGDRIVCLDLDLIVTGPLDHLFYRPEPFCILQGANAANPCPFNGSVWMLRAGYRPDVWSEFSLEAAAKTKHFEFPDDQGWFWDRIPDAAGWQAGTRSGIYAYQKPGWPKGDALPHDAKIVCFPGKRDPSQFTHLPWVKEHWVNAAS